MPSCHVSILFIFYNKNAEVLCILCSILKFIVHNAPPETMRFYPPTNLISLSLSLIVSFTFGFRCLISCANIEFLFYLFLEENLGCNKDLFI